MKKYLINLKPKEAQNFSDKLVYFFLHYLRYVIVMTQIVVIGVFFFRFQIDQEIIDLKESIGQKEEIIKVTKPLVDDGKAINDKTTFIKSLLDDQKRDNNTISYLFSIVTQDMILKNLKMEDKKITVMGAATNVEAIKNFVARGESDKQFKKIVLGDVSKDTTGYAFLVEFEM